MLILWGEFSHDKLDGDLYSCEAAARLCKFIPDEEQLGSRRKVEVTDTGSNEVPKDAWGNEHPALPSKRT